MDSFFRSTTHTPKKLQAGVESLGIAIPVLSQQKRHGKLTGRLNALESRVKGQHAIAVQAEIDEARQYLREAAKIIWTKSIISKAKQANWYLLLASGCVSGAEHNLQSR